MTSRCKYLSSFQNLRQAAQQEELKTLHRDENPGLIIALCLPSPQLTAKSSGGCWALLPLSLTLPSGYSALLHEQEPEVPQDEDVPPMFLPPGWVLQPQDY